MLKGIDPLLDAELLGMLAAMGHGDQLVLADRNFPAASVARHTVSGSLVGKDIASVTALARAICSVLPLDDFVEAPVQFMQVAGEPGRVLPVHEDMQAVVDAAEGRKVKMSALERLAFYTAARQCYGVVSCLEARPYGCFILTKGVIFE